MISVATTPRHSQQGTVLGSGRPSGHVLQDYQLFDRLEIYEDQEEAAKQAMLDVYQKSEYKEYLDSIWGTSPTVNALVLGLWESCFMTVLPRWSSLPVVTPSLMNLANLEEGHPYPIEAAACSERQGIVYRLCLKNGIAFSGHSLITL